MTPAQEAERLRIAQRDKLERKHSKEIEAALSAMLTAVIKPGMTDAEIASAPNKLKENSKELEAALLAYTLAMSEIATDAARDDLLAVGLDVDMSQVDVQAKEAARLRVAEVLPVLLATTGRALMSALPVWLANPGRNVSDLLTELAPQMNTARAESIARTEGTAMMGSGVNAVSREAGVTQVQWVTALDENVCPICQPMQGKRREVNGTYDNGMKYPPAHPNCRCAELLIVRSVS
jgi:SPP1 gp7 family putative phage head morphogenesis protein